MSNVLCINLANKLTASCCLLALTRAIGERVMV